MPFDVPVPRVPAPPDGRRLDIRDAFTELLRVYGPVAVFVFLVVLVGAADRLFLAMSVSYVVQTWIARGLAIGAPLVVYVATKRICRELLAQERTQRPRRPGPVRRGGDPGREHHTVTT